MLITRNLAVRAGRDIGGRRSCSSKASKGKCEGNEGKHVEEWNRRDFGGRIRGNVGGRRMLNVSPRLSSFIPNKSISWGGSTRGGREDDRLNHDVSDVVELQTQVLARL